MENLLSIKQVQEKLQLCRNKVMLEIISCRLKAYKVGKQWRIKPEDLREYLEGER